MGLGDSHDNTPPVARTPLGNPKMPLGEIPNVNAHIGVSVNVNIGAALDGQPGVDVVSPDEIVLLMAQTDPSENGVWVEVNGAPPTRHTSYDASADFDKLFSVTVSGGSNAGLYYFMPQAAAFTLDTSPANFTKHLAVPISLGS